MPVPSWRRPGQLSWSRVARPSRSDRVAGVVRGLERLNVTFSSAISDELEMRVTEARGQGIAPDDLVDHVRDGLPYRVVSRIALEAVRAEVERSDG